MRRTCLAVLAGVAALSAGVAAAAVEPASWPPRSSSTAATVAVSGDAERLYLLSFEDAPLATVAQEVLGATLNVPYAVDPGLEVPVDFEAADRMTPAQLLGAFEAAMADQGIRVSRSGGSLTLKARGSDAPVSAAISAAPGPTAEASPRRPANAEAALWVALLRGLSGAAVAGIAALAVLYFRPVLVRPLVGPTRREAAPDDRLVNAPQRAAVLERLLADAVPHPTALARARVIAARTGSPLEQVLNWTGVVSDEALAQAYATVLELPLWSPGDRPPIDTPARVAALFPQTRLVLVAGDGARATVATDDPLDDWALTRVAAATGRAVSVVVARAGDIDRARNAEAHEMEPQASATPALVPGLALDDAQPARGEALVFTRV